MISSKKVGINENTQAIREHKERKKYGVPRLQINMGKEEREKR